MSEAQRPRKYRKGRESWGRIKEVKGRFYASYLHDGTLFHAGKGFTTRTDARAFLRKTEAEIQRGVWKHPDAAPAKKFGAYAKDWIAARSNVTTGAALRPKTRSEYERLLAGGLAVFADRALTSIKTADVAAWNAERLATGKRTQAAAEARLLRAVFNSALEHELVARNPVPSSATKTSSGKSFEVPLESQVDALHDAIDDRFKLAIRLAAWGGLRLSEWRALRRCDLELVDGQYLVRVERQAQFIKDKEWDEGPPKSAHGKRTIPLPTWMTPEVDEHMTRFKVFEPESLLFPPQRQSKFIHNSTFYAAWNAARDEVGVRATVREHDLRRFAGSHFLDSTGGNLIEARDFLGHASAATTEKHYIVKVTDRSRVHANRMPVPASVRERMGHAS